MPVRPRPPAPSTSSLIPTRQGGGPGTSVWKPGVSPSIAADAMRPPALDWRLSSRSPPSETLPRRPTEGYSRIKLGRTRTGMRVNGLVVGVEMSAASHPRHAACWRSGPRGEGRRLRQGVPECIGSRKSSETRSPARLFLSIGLWLQRPLDYLRRGRVPSWAPHESAAQLRRPASPKNPPPG